MLVVAVEVVIMLPWQLAGLVEAAMVVFIMPGKHLQQVLLIPEEVEVVRAIVVAEIALLQQVVLV